MRKNKIVNKYHDLLLQKINKDLVIVDATCGNGHDTFFLAPIVKHVHSFDIQLDALNNAKVLNENYKNITYHHTSYKNIISVVKDYDGVIFNLGYLPGSNKEIKTNHFETIETLKLLHKNKKGFILICAYPGHIEGELELVAIQSFLDKNDIKYRVLRNEFFTKKEAPVIFYWDY